MVGAKGAGPEWLPMKSDSNPSSPLASLPGSPVLFKLWGLGMVGVVVLALGFLAHGHHHLGPLQMSLRAGIWPPGLFAFASPPSPMPMQADIKIFDVSPTNHTPQRPPPASPFQVGEGGDDNVRTSKSCEIPHAVRGVQGQVCDGDQSEIEVLGATMRMFPHLYVPRPV